MRRREFLTGAAAVAGLGTKPVSGMFEKTPLPGQQQDKRGRIAMMTLNFTSLLKTPWQAPSPDRTLDIVDLPQMYVDTYGVHNIELQHYHLASTEPSFYRELKARIDKAQCKVSQLVVEFGGLNISAPDHNFLPRLQAIDLTKVWIDRCEVLACPRIMVNQGTPTPENKGYAVETLKAMQDYGATKGVKVSMETRGGGGGAAAAAPGATPPAAPAEPAWVILNEVATAAGAYINIDLGGVGARSQEELHTAIRALLPRSSGSMHIKRSAVWDLATAMKFVESLGYTGIYSIEARGHDATRDIYNTILENI